MADIQNAPRNLTMQDFRSAADQFGALAKSCRFLAVIRPYGQYMSDYFDFSRDLMYVCESTDIPGRGMVNIDLRYYGPSFKLPIQSQYEDINMTFLCRTQSYERQFFDDWMNAVNPINTYDFNYLEDYASTIDVYQFAEYSTVDSTGPDAPYCHTLNKAYPILINSQPVSWSDDTFQRLVVTFTYTNWSRRTLDPTNRGGDNLSYNLVERRENDR